MMTASDEQKLPLDIQAFEIMWGENCLYVDKTRPFTQWRLVDAITFSVNLCQFQRGNP